MSTIALFNEASNTYDTMDDEFLKVHYVPNVYQESIYSIDYDKLKSHGVELLSFDIDETIAGDDDKYPPKPAVTLFEDLKKKGFQIMLLTNTNVKRAKLFGNFLGVKYIAGVKKPLTENFHKILKEHKLKPNQMAHIGNSQFDDVAGGNSTGIVTCLIKNISGRALSNDETKLRNELNKRDIWKSDIGFYQLGER